MFKFTLESALKANDQGKLHQWVVDYLNSEGENKKLAKVLKEEKNMWINLAKYPLAKLKRVMGPEKKMIFHENTNKWERRISSFVKSIKSKDFPPPLIASDFWQDIHIADGTHRFEALKRLGYKKYWTIFYIKEKSNKQKILKNIS